MLFLMTNLLATLQHTQVAVHTRSFSTFASTHNTPKNRYKVHPLLKVHFTPDFTSTL